MFQTYLIGLREGLEAALIIGILVAYLVKTSRRSELGFVWIGVGLAVALSLGVGALLTFTSREVSWQETFGGVMAIVAVVFVTWMIFWMRSTSHQLKAELHRVLDSALAMGPLALVGASFLSVGREGLETALFIWPLTQASQGGSANRFFGALLGLLTAVVIGYLIYRRSIHFDLGKFFRVTGAFLVIVAAGVLAYGVHDLQEGNVLPGLHNLAWDVSDHIGPKTFLGTVLKGTINFSPQTTWLELITWLCYAVPVMILFLRPQRGTRAHVPPQSAPTVPASSTH